MSEFNRATRVSNQIQRCLSDVLLRHPPRDPRVKPISILRVSLTADLRIARVYFLPMGEDKNGKEISEGLRSASGYLSRILAKELHMKYVPRLEFFEDTITHKASEVLQIIESLGKEENEENSSDENID
jgi:ribosome-binding factor A